MEKRTLVKVRAHTSKPGMGLSYPELIGTLEEYCDGEGWDVVEVRLQNGGIESVYSFDVTRIKRRVKK